MTRKTRKQSTVLKDYVTVALAEDTELAQEYSKLLADHEIPCEIRHMGQSGQGDRAGIAVMVPEECIDEAYVLISEEASYDDFFDAAFHDHKPGGFDQRDMLFDDDEDEDDWF